MIYVLIVFLIIEVIIIEVRLKKKQHNDERIIARLDLLIKEVRNRKNH
ncbi:hypothetical protein JCM10914A_49870 [Paenibacillus sp. JCM 10914]